MGLASIDELLLCFNILDLSVVTQIKPCIPSFHANLSYFPTYACMPFFHANLSYFPRYACMSFFRANLSYFPIVECIQKCLLVSLILEWILIDGLSFPFLTKLVTDFFKVQDQFYSNSIAILLSNNFTLQLQLITPS